MSATRLAPPWLAMDFAGERRVLSWTLNRPGFAMARRILWREVRNSDLSEHFDVGPWLAAELAALGEADTPCFLTSRNIARFTEARAEVDGIAARCVATVGLSNAERVGRRMDYSQIYWGTVNLAVEVDAGLTEAAQLEAMSIATQARTLAIVEHGPELAVGRATGTGTDCLAIAAPVGEEAFAGLHTALGEAIGRAAYDAVAAGTKAWMASPPEPPKRPETED